jgi:uncharacterized protein YkwD
MRTGSTRRTTKIGALIAGLAIAGLAAACGPTPDAGPAPAAPAAPAAAAAAPTCQGPGAPPDAATSTIFNLTNASRASAGLSPLTWDTQLWCLASGWSKEMGDSNNMHHRDLASVLGSSGYGGYQTIGENVLFGPSNMSADAMHSAWMNSPSHRENILSGAFRSFAVATYTVNGQVWATENFGS